MSETTVLDSQSNLLIAVTDVSKIFLGGNETIADSYVNNTSYDPITLLAGTVMGRVATTQVLVPCESTASDGSQFPVGILGQDLVIDAGDTVKALVFVSGRVAEEKVDFFLPTDNLNTVVSSRSYRDRIGADTVGIKLVKTAQNSYEDNS